MALSGISSSCEVFIPCGACKTQLSAPTISLSPCSHNLHERCFNQLPSNNCPQCKLPIADVKKSPELEEIVAKVNDVVSQKPKSLNPEALLIKDLHAAVEKDEPKSVACLLEAGASATSLVNGLSPLYKASIKKNQTIVQLLLKKNADPNQTNDLSYLKHSDPCWIVQDFPIIHNDTPMRVSARLGCLDVIHLFIEHKAPFDNRGGPFGYTPLFISLLNRHEDLSLFFIDQGADIRKKDTQGRSLMHIAAGSGCLKVVQKLFQRGLDINEETKRNLTPLHEAARSQDSSVLEFLLLNGAIKSINTKWLGEWTPLSIAAEAKNKKNVELLLQAGADLFELYEGLSLLRYIQKKLEKNKSFYQENPQCNDEKAKEKIANDQDFYEFLDKIIGDFLKEKAFPLKVI